MVIAAGISCFGLMIGRRMFTHLDQNHILDSKISKRTWIIFILIQLSLFIVVRDQNLVHWCLELGTLLLPMFTYIFQNLSRMAQFRCQLVPLFDHLILQMRSGRTLKDSLVASTEGFSQIQYYIFEILSLLQYETSSASPIHDKLFIRVTNELLEIHKTSFKSTERLKAFRNKLKTEQDFRQKSAQVTLQIRLQAVVLSVLYVGLLFYVLWSYRWSEVQFLVFLSLLLFLSGLILLLSIPKGFRWKV